MRQALRLARKCADLGEVPVGAVLVGPEGLLSFGANRRETLQTPLGHAEVMALHKAAKLRKNWRLADTTLYVTLEPCLMCAGAILQSRVGRVVYGALDPRGGAVESLYKTFQDPRLNHQVSLTGGVLAEECGQVLQDFFKGRRHFHKSAKAAKQFRFRSSVVVIHDGKILGFHAIDPHNAAKYFFLPGGMIEPEENPRDCAVREAFEETGYRIQLIPDLELRRRYDFEWDGKINHCDTLFYLGTLAEAWHPAGKVQDAAYHKGVDWVGVRDAKKVFGYHPDILWGVQWAIKHARNYSLTSKR